MFFHRLFGFGVAIGLATGPAAAQDLDIFAPTPDNLRQYTECMSLARSEPMRAVPQAERWMNKGGGLGARHCLAIATFEAGRYTRAADQLEAIARDMGEQRPGLRAELWAQAGQAWIAAGQADKAALAQSRALDLKKDDADLWVDRALSYATTNEWPRAVSDFDQALILRPNDVEILVLRSAAWRYAGNLARSLADAQVALKIAPDNTAALLERGFTYSARGDRAKAQADFTKVVKLVPPGSEAAKRAEAGLQGEQPVGLPAANGRPAAGGQKR
ncbi:hypothetical protein SAMN02745126_02410 [Enhydrobacter aerosaccus]|uniref:Uncharacterized protein n=2 Tax=Enhydrobacter aerosaccus TaxID=225324 RepID=A0A1T4NRT6_9HYPH|nr:hypothetical protein SAMN02745126_02410 [Enhydrobacter aerosaccus]